MEPYKRIDAQKIYYEKREIRGKVVAVLDLILDKRELSLIIPQSRVLKQGEIHEVIFTPERKAAPGDKVDKVAYVGFFEVEEGGVAIIGDILEIEGKELATLIGFNETHMPNHQNIVFFHKDLITGKGLGISVGDSIKIKRSKK